MRKVIISITVLMLAVVAFWISSINRNDALGEINITVYNQLDEDVINDNYNFTSEDTLLEILLENYTVGCADSSYDLTDVCESIFGTTVILKIGDVETDWDHNYIAIYVNDLYSSKGVEDVVLIDDAEYRFEFTEVGGGN